MEDSLELEFGQVEKVSSAMELEEEDLEQVISRIILELGDLSISNDEVSGVSEVTLRD